jgi:gliding-associated putative ABC transporter substrate-binding component GldG
MKGLLNNNKIWWLPLIILLILLNLLASWFHTRIDLTDEKRFTVSAPVKNLLRKLDTVVTIDVFLKGELPSGFKKLATTTGELLEEFKETGKNKIQYRFVAAEDQMENTERTYADTLTSMGVEPINLKVHIKSGEQSQYVFPAALIHYRERTQPVNLYSGTKIFITPAELNSAEALLEYNFADAIQQLTEKVKPLVAYSIGNGEPVGTNTYDLVENVLKKEYDLFTININTQPTIPDTFKVLMIVKPSIPFNENEKIKIDQYVMHGGKIIWCLDKLEAEMDSLRIKNKVVAYDRNLNLDDLLFKYGVRINSDLVMDLQCDFLQFDVNGSGQFEFLHWNYFPLFQSKSNHVINKHIGLVAGRFVNSLDTVKAGNITKTVLLSSSPNTKLILAPALISGEENRNAPEDQQFKSRDVPVAVLAEGKFSSLYANRVPVSVMDSLAKYGSPFQSSCIYPNKMIITGDGDMALNGVLQNKPLPMGVNPFTVQSQYEYQFANKDFIQNCLSYLINSSGIAEAKGKDYTLLLLDPKKTNEQRIIWQVVDTALPVFLVLIFGIIYRFLRKRKYTQA